MGHGAPGWRPPATSHDPLVGVEPPVPPLVVVLLLDVLVVVLLDVLVVVLLLLDVLVVAPPPAPLVTGSMMVRHPGREASTGASKSKEGRCRRVMPSSRRRVRAT